MAETNINIIDLGKDIWIYCCSYLDVGDVFRFSNVCKFFSVVGQDPNSITCLRINGEINEFHTQKRFSKIKSLMWHQRRYPQMHYQVPPPARPELFQHHGFLNLKHLVLDVNDFFLMDSNVIELGKMINNSERTLDSLYVIANISRTDINSINVHPSLELLVANATRSTLKLSCWDNDVIALANQFDNQQFMQQTASAFNEIQVVSKTYELGLVEAIKSGYFKFSEFDMNAWVNRLENDIFALLNPWIPLLNERSDACVKNLGVQTFSLSIIMDSNCDEMHRRARNNWVPAKQILMDLCELISMLRNRLEHTLHANKYKHITYELHTREPAECGRITKGELLEFKITKAFACTINN
eukprot:53425_1